MKNKGFSISAIIILIVIVAGTIILVPRLIGNGKNSNNSSNELTIATIGDVKHGKAQLTSVLTKYYGKYVSEQELEKSQEYEIDGIHYNTSIVKYKSENKTYTQYYFPSYGDTIKALITGNAKIDGAIVIVDAKEGPNEQSKAQLSFLKKLGIKGIVLYINNGNLVDDSRIKYIVDEIKELIYDDNFDKYELPYIKGSTSKALNGDEEEIKKLAELINLLDKHIVQKNENKVQNSNIFNAEIYKLLSSENGSSGILKNNSDVIINIDGKEYKGKIIIDENLGFILPGDNQTVSITFDKKIKLNEGLNFKIIENNKTIAIGIITNIS